MENFLGKDGFVWWVGVVEDINDPLTLGRCKVRIFGYHTSHATGEVKTDDLPWAIAIHPVNTPNLYGAPKIGSFVFGFFLDSVAAQEPAILGYFPSIPEEIQDFTEDYFGKTPTDFTRSFASVTQKDSVVLDINGAKIEITTDGDIFFTSKSVERISLETIISKINVAQDHANSAFDKANTVGDDLNVVEDVNLPSLNSRINVVYEFANVTYDITSSSYDTANQAFDQANGAYDTANQVFEHANGAYDTANQAFDQANGAFDKANTALAISFVL